MRRLLKLLGATVGVVLIGAVLVLLQARWEIRSINPSLPTSADIDSALANVDTPVRISYVLTAEQIMPTVPDRSSRVSDRVARRTDVVDRCRMTREGAVSFGKPFELLGGQPSDAYGSLGEQLGDRVPAVGAVVFTHLHVDHTGGNGSSVGNTRGITIFQTPLQADRVNYLTRGGKPDIAAAACATAVRLDGGPISSIPEYPGIVVVVCGRPPPCSTMYFVKIGDVTWALVGDISFSRQDIAENRSRHSCTAT